MTHEELNKLKQELMVLKSMLVVMIEKVEKAMKEAK